MDDQLIDKLTAEAAEDGIVQLVVGAVITDSEDRVLLLKRPADDFMGGLWELPSGKVDPGERLDTALTREVKEETGLDLTEITAYLGHFDYTSGSGKPTRQFNFAITTTAAEPVILTEHDEHQWVLISGDLPVSNAVELILRTLRERAIFRGSPLCGGRERSLSSTGTGTVHLADGRTCRSRASFGDLINTALPTEEQQP